jgi:hypothetical protein
VVQDELILLLVPVTLGSIVGNRRLVLVGEIIRRYVWIIIRDRRLVLVSEIVRRYVWIIIRDRRLVLVKEIIRRLIGVSKIVGRHEYIIYLIIISA